MLNLKEYSDKTKKLADYLPWACMPEPGYVVNKDGSFQTTFAYRGPDLESATEAELVTFMARANNVFRRFGSGWALFFEAARNPALDYPYSEFGDPASWLLGSRLNHSQNATSVASATAERKFLASLS
jgi:type IV secretion system protein VirB4